MNKHRVVVVDDYESVVETLVARLREKVLTLRVTARLRGSWPKRLMPGTHSRNSQTS
jgi:hypothetical protein